LSCRCDEWQRQILALEVVAVNKANTAGTRISSHHTLVLVVLEGGIHRVCVLVAHLEVNHRCRFSSQVVVLALMAAG
jgi:hypothetical protein